MIKKLLDRLRQNGLQVTLLGLTIVAAILMVVFRDRIWPVEKLYDALHIGRVARGEEAPMDDKYELVGGVYGALGLGNLEMLVGIVTVLLVAGLVFWIFRHNSKLRLASFLMAIVVIGLASAFFSGFSKELFEILIVCLVGVLTLDKKWGWLALGIASLVYGAIFRPYWVVIGLLYFGWLGILHLFRGKHVSIILPIFATMVVGAVIGYALSTGGQDISIQRPWINDGRISGTKINNILPEESIVSGVVNSFAALLWFFLPWQLFVDGSWFYISGGLLIMGVMWGFLWWLFSSEKIQWKRGTTAALALVLAFLVVSCLFEPDFRSFLRHLTPIMLFMIYCYNTTIFHKKEKIS